MKIGRFRTNKQAEVDGVWVDGGEGLKLLIARLGNNRYQEAMRRHGSPLMPQIRNQSVTTEQATEVTCRAMAETILLGWKNLQDDDGNDIPYSSEKAFELLRDVKDFRDMVTDLASTVQLYRAEQIKDVLGN